MNTSLPFSAGEQHEAGSKQSHRLQGGISQDIELFKVTAVRTSNPT
jgi:hypothetical protein